jgi:pimeloyl-ACP methyl ester carboxylesterase
VATFQELTHKYTNDHSRFLVIDDMFVHYRDQGEGEPIVLLHGAFSSLHTFNDWSKILQKHYRVISLDLMGFGLTGPNKTGDYTIGNHIRVLKRFFNILGLKKAHLVGSSLGGWLAWEFTYRYPQRINKLVLVDSAGFLDKENMPLPFKLAQSPLAGRVLKYIVRKSILEQFVKQVYYDISKINTKLVDRYFDLFTREGNSQALVDLVNAPFQENTDFLSQIEHPTLIMWGREDAWIGAINAYLFDKMLPNSELIIYEEVGHLPMEEIPVRSGEDLMAFLKK